MMPDKAFYHVSSSVSPYINLALEEYLFNTLGRGECVFYLWQNSDTVVIGRNQNYIKECNTEALFARGGHLARRLSGGGAVYHDMGNLNFTFIFNREYYSVPRQLGVITRALAEYGIAAELTGRNDVAVNGKKVSGNAFYESGSRCLHHGTLLVDVNTDRLSEVLTVPREKLAYKGVDSVRSRVVNLRQLNPAVTPEGLISPLLCAFAGVYGVIPTELSPERTAGAPVTELTAKYASDSWRLNKTPPDALHFAARTGHGAADVYLNVTDGVITDAQIYTDSLETEAYITACSLMKGVKLNRAALKKALPPSVYTDDIISIIFDKG